MRFTLSLVMSFTLGMSFINVLGRYANAQSQIPSGTYTTALVADGASYQVNMSNVDLASDDSVITWIREDRTRLFKTTFSKVAVNCSTGKVAILEQRRFGPGMIYLGSSKGNDQMSEPSTPTSMLAVTDMCAADIQKAQQMMVDPPVQAPNPQLTIV